MASGPGDYRFEYAGATGVVTIPTPAEDAAVAKYEAYRKLAKAPKVVYVKAVVDNSKGTENINMYQVVVVGEDGQQIEVGSPDDTVSDWQDAFETNSRKGVERYNQGVNLINRGHVYLRPGAKGTAILISPSPITSVQRVFVYPAGGFDQVEATKLP